MGWGQCACCIDLTISSAMLRSLGKGLFLLLEHSTEPGIAQDHRGREGGRAGEQAGRQAGGAEVLMGVQNLNLTYWSKLLRILLSLDMPISKDRHFKAKSK